MRNLLGWLRLGWLRLGWLRMPQTRKDPMHTNITCIPHTPIYSHILLQAPDVLKRPTSAVVTPSDATKLAPYPSLTYMFIYLHHFSWPATDFFSETLAPAHLRISGASPCSQRPTLRVQINRRPGAPRRRSVQPREGVARDDGLGDGAHVLFKLLCFKSCLFAHIVFKKCAHFATNSVHVCHTFATCLPHACRMLATIRNIVPMKVHCGKSRHFCDASARPG